LKNASLFFLIIITFPFIFLAKGETATFKRKPTSPEYSTITLCIPNEKGNIVNFWVEDLVKDDSGKSKIIGIIVCDKNGLPQYYMDENQKVKARYLWQSDAQGNLQNLKIVEVETAAEGKEIVTKSWKYDSEGKLEYRTDAEGKIIKPLKEEVSFDPPREMEILDNTKIIAQTIPERHKKIENKKEKTSLKNKDSLLQAKKRYPFPKFMLGQTGFIIYVAVFALFAGAVVGFIVYTFHSSK